MGAGAAASVLAVSAIMLFVPIASAASASATISRPYTSLGSSTSFNAQQGACGHASVIKTPSWKSATGEFRSVLSSSAPLCKNKISANVAIAGASLNLIAAKVNLASVLKSSLPPTLNITWLMHVNETWDVSPYSGCVLNYNASYSICQSYAEDSIYGSTELIDLTNSTWGNGYGYEYASFDIYASTFEYVQNYSQNYYCGVPVYCHGGGNYSFGTIGPGAFTGVVTGVNDFNLTGTNAIAPHDHYELQIGLSFEAIAESYTQSAKGIGHSSSSAYENIGTHGNGAVLVNITWV